MNASFFNRRNAFNRANQLTFNCALIIDLLSKLRDAKFLIVDQLKAGVPFAHQGREQGGQPAAGVAHGQHHAHWRCRGGPVVGVLDGGQRVPGMGV